MGVQLKVFNWLLYNLVDSFGHLKGGDGNRIYDEKGKALPQFTEVGVALLPTLNRRSV